MFKRSFHSLPSPGVSLLAALRKQRLRDFDGTQETGAVADLDLKTECAFDYCSLCAGTSSRLVEHSARDNDSWWIKKYLPTASVIDLGLYPSIEHYRRQVSIATEGKYTSSERKARRLGYSARRIGPGSHQRSLYAIRASKPRRSKGRVWYAFEEPAAGLRDIDVAFKKPACAEHWRIEWGGFRGGPEGDELLAHASLLRSGNQLQIIHFMGHGSALADGVTKILMFDIMDWLLSREETCVQGLRYFMYGHVEDGSKGLADWKRYSRFLPTLIQCAYFAEPTNIEGFDAAAYLALNPDLAKAGVDPYRHYITHGLLEGRKTSYD